MTYQEITNAISALTDLINTLVQPSVSRMINADLLDITYAQMKKLVVKLD